MEHRARGAKSAEHLEALRQSNPCYGSLVPKVDRPAAHEVSYDPLTRWNVMAPLLRQPRGAKSAEHLEALRQSDPSFGSLDLSILKYMPMVDDESEFSTLEQLRKLRAEGALSLKDGGWKLLQPAKKTFNFDSFDEYTDDESSESGDGVSELPPGGLAAWRARRSAREERASNTSDSSEMSNARTMERASNDSLLEDDFPELASPHRRKGRASGDIELPEATKAATAPEPVNLHAGWRIR